MTAGRPMSICTKGSRAGLVGKNFWAAGDEMKASKARAAGIFRAGSLKTMSVARATNPRPDIKRVPAPQGRR